MGNIKNYNNLTFYHTLPERRTQKRVLKLKTRYINISGPRINKEHIIIFANKNIRITQEQIKSIKTDLTSIKGLTGGKLKDVTLKINLIPNKVLTNKGILVRMGKGKGKMKTLAKYLTKGTICIELIPGPVKINKTSEQINYKVLNKIITKFTKKYTFFSFKYLI